MQVIPHLWLGDPREEAIIFNGNIHYRIMDCSIIIYSVKLMFIYKVPIQNLKFQLRCQERKEATGNQTK